MKILTATKDGDYIVRLTGEIDHHSATGLREQIDRELETLRPKRLILDLSATSFMDSSGLGLILGRLRKSQELGAELVLANPTGATVKILRLAGVEKLLTIRYLLGKTDEGIEKDSADFFFRSQ
jgi:stage II sporulation protein AA (anti-sigma F factor antagonist)